jgi:hypothetical protein
MIQKTPFYMKVYKFAKKYFFSQIYWMIKNFLRNNFQKLFRISIDNKYQIVLKCVMVKFALPKSTILLILLFLWINHNFYKINILFIF